MGGARRRAGNVRFRATARDELPRRGRHHHELHCRLHSAVRAGSSHARKEPATSQRWRWCGKFNGISLLYFVYIFVGEEERYGGDDALICFNYTLFSRILLHRESLDIIYERIVIVTFDYTRGTVSCF